MDNNSLVEIKNSIIGEKGLFALIHFAKDQVVFVLDGKIYNSPTRESIHVGNGVHIHDDYGAYINHSFDPSTRIEGRFVIAIKEINVGDEITFNYNASEINMACPFTVDGIEVKGK
jgi:hypothetical protein